jgi:hypothetical protein
VTRTGTTFDFAKLGVADCGRVYGRLLFLGQLADPIRVFGVRPHLRGEIIIGYGVPTPVA